MDTSTLEKLERQVLKFAERYLNESGLGNNWKLQPLVSDGSTRLFWRLSSPDSDTTFIAMANPPAEDFTRAENQAYLHIGRHLHEKGIHVPRIFAQNMLRGFFLMSDLGQKSLQVITRDQADPMSYYENVLEQLLELHTVAPEGFDTHWCCQTPVYDKYVMRSLESDYFKKAFLIAYLGLKQDWKSLDPEFEYLADKVSSCRADSVIHRDFQSRNIMIREDWVGILDWQGARLGPPAYDLAALVIDPYVDLDWSFREEIRDRYIEGIEDSHPQWAEDIKRYFWYVAIQRNLQILGAFGFLTKQRQKQTFKQYIPDAVNSLFHILDSLGDKQLASLKDLARDIKEILHTP